MNEKLILEIQETLKALIYSKRKVREKLLWTLNMQIEELRKHFSSKKAEDQKGPELQTLEYKIAEELNINILYSKEEDMYFFYKHSAHIKYEDTFFRRNIFATYTSCKDLVSSSHKYLNNVEIIKPIHPVIELYIINFAIGYCILNYGTNKDIFYPIYEMQDMFFRDKEERVIELFARTLLLPTSYILEKLSYEREKEIKHIKNLYLKNKYEYISNLDICWDEALGFSFFIPIRIQETRELIADISVTYPKLYEEIKAKYPLLFGDSNW